MSSHPAPDRAPVVPLRPVVPGQPLWRDVVGAVLRGERLARGWRLKDVAEAARISVPYLSEIERGRKEASSEVLAAAAGALGLGLGDVLSLARDAVTRGTSAQANPALEALSRSGAVLGPRTPPSRTRPGGASTGQVLLAA
ncbi:helix-turn-helix transcriptional regulator [Streptomyces sp. NBC_01754]|uniref:helix-turn-helix domain-containing protein n=1 Tax=Streptomyces sp. NBC_01754 TaxID=2975930 RepID=UPI002DD84692|nr:helix-turn-helix transcriptional regulator [Streptomyces sp. NBC_01754]WSC94517.1 helix-turn-helix transcriptional regulator [Streptomyces sp. NBC_01754]